MTLVKAMSIETESRMGRAAGIADVAPASRDHDPARRSSALMRALGAEARQVSSGLVVAQVLSAFPGAIIGIPLGLGLFKVAVSDGSLPSPLWLITTVIGTLVVMAALTVIPARIGSMQSIVGALQAEAT